MFRYEVHAKGSDFAEKHRPGEWAAVVNLLTEIAGNAEEDCARYYLSGREVPYQKMMAAACAASDDWYSARKQISWRTSWCENSRVYAWVLK